MTDFPLHDPATAPEAARPWLDRAAKVFGFAPNVLKVMAEAPALLEGYMTLSGIFDKTSFSPAERQLILLAAARTERCHYCVAAHSWAAEMAGLPKAVVEAVREGREIADDPRLESLRRFVTHLVSRQGFADAEEIEAFLAGGFTRAQALEIVLGVALKVMSTWTNHLARTPLDEPLSAYAWQPSAGDDLAAE
ncbi:MAG: carboxymuconolactone decarboxylase family protein [Alphaproteobacteria bacterium]|nr:MAG: carboxymuconolactone decarboxylase family protein [Alphaproteobacteria bacterium]